MDIDLNDLNSAQLVALNQIDGAVMVLAGAGSGKTRLVTYRIAHLIKTLNVSPYNILAITFTNKATNEMRDRLFYMLGDDAKDIWISTFHSMCVRILRSNIGNLKNSDGTSNFDKNFSIYTDTERDRALKTVVKDLGLNEDSINKYGYHISNAKNQHLSPWDYQKAYQDLPYIDEVTKVYSAYQSFLASNNALDFDDLLVKTYDLFLEYPNVLKRYQQRFKYIHVDEFQDTNKIQYLLVRALAGEYKNLFVVGDEDQCIYSWRGASISNISDFKRDFPEYKLFKLEQNYRSTKLILEMANKLIKNNNTRNDKVLWTDNEIGTKVEFRKAKDEFEEAEYVAQTISNLVNNEGYSYKDFAVLTRLNAMTAPLEEKFLNYNISYKMFGGKKFFERLEIKNVLSYLKMLTNKYDSTSFVRIVNFPKRGIGDTTVKTILDLATFHKVTPYDIILSNDEYLVDTAIIKKVKPFKDLVERLLQEYETLEPLQFIEKMIKEVGFYEEYSEQTDEDINRIMNINNFIMMASNYFKDNPKDDISDFLQSITLISDIDDYDDNDNSVAIATVHAVKGLEFKCVFVVGLEERMFPIIRLNSTDADMEEERRLMFVAITRAEERLYLSCSGSRFMYGRRDYMTPSRFLKECGILDEKPLFRRETYNEVKQTTAFQNFQKKSFSLGGKTESKQDMDIEKKYAIGKRVSHPKFGKGTITGNFGITTTKCVTINFDDIGTKTLSVEYAPITVID